MAVAYGQRLRVRQDVSAACRQRAALDPQAATQSARFGSTLNSLALHSVAHASRRVSQPDAAMQAVQPGRGGGCAPAGEVNHPAASKRAATTALTRMVAAATGQGRT